jgi:hypothetical protein
MYDGNINVFVVVILNSFCLLECKVLTRQSLEYLRSTELFGIHIFEIKLFHGSQSLMRETQEICLFYSL